MEKIIIFTSPNKPNRVSPGVPPPNQLSYQSSAKSKAKFSRKANTSLVNAIEDGLYVYELDLMKKKGVRIQDEDDDPEELALQRAVEEKRRRSRDESLSKSPVLASQPPPLSFLPPSLVLSPAPAEQPTGSAAPPPSSAPIAIGDPHAAAAKTVASSPSNTARAAAAAAAAGAPGPHSPRSSPRDRSFISSALGKKRRKYVTLIEVKR